MNWSNPRSAAPAAAATAPAPYRMIRSRDVEEVLASVPKWQLDNRLLASVNGTSQGAMLRVGAVGIASNRITGLVHSRGSVPAGSVSFGIDIAAQPSRRFGGRPLGADDALLGYSGAELDYLLAPTFCGLSITLPAASIELALAQRSGRPPYLSLFRSVRVAHLPRAASPDLWALFGRLGEALHSGRCPVDETTSPFVEAEVTDAIVTVIERHNASDSDDGRQQWHHRRPIVLRAQEYMEAYAHEPITLGQICAAARASQRTVEYAFRDIYGVSAKKFLKLLRLNEVKRQLRAAHDDRPSIADIAHQAGFWHMGHFTADYRRLFGETATQTLDRRFGKS
jgi:AraC family ethanolamine operon transcriptional activator